MRNQPRADAAGLILNFAIISQNMEKTLQKQKF